MRNIRSLRTVASLLLALLFVPTCALAQADNPAPFIDPSTWMSRLAQDVIAPGYERLYTQNDALHRALSDLCAQPGDASLQAAQARWSEAALTLRLLSPLPFGPSLEQRTLRRIDFWPTRTRQIETSIKSAPASRDAMKRIGFSAQGFPALEYLLFDQERAPLGQDADACRYATLVAEQTLADIGPLRNAWTDWPTIDPEDEAAQQNRLLSDGLNILIGSTEVLRLKYLEKPTNSSSPQPDFDAWRSGASGAHIKRYFDGLQAALQGGVSSVGLTAYLRGRGLQVLSERLDETIAHTRKTIDALPAQFRNAADKAAAQRAADALATLHVLLAQDVAEAIKVSVGFGESDGD